MVVTYLPVKFDIDRTNIFLVRVRKQKSLTNKQKCLETDEQTE